MSLDTAVPVPGLDYQGQDSQIYLFASPGETEVIDAPMDGVAYEPFLDYPPQGSTSQQFGQVPYDGYLLPGAPPDPEYRDSGLPYESVGDSDLAGAGTWVEDARMSNFSYYNGSN